MSASDLLRWLNESTEEQVKSTFNKQVKSTVSCFNFSKMCTFPFVTSMNITRDRYVLPGVGSMLYDMQDTARKFQIGLERETETFRNLHASFERYLSKVHRDGMVITEEFLRSFYERMSQKFGQSMIRILDPFGNLRIEDWFIIDFTAMWNMPDEMKDLLDDNELNPDVMDADLLDHLNTAFVMIVSVAFLAAFHYSAMKRFFYMTFFKKILNKCFSLCYKDVSPHAAVSLLASVQLDRKKRRLILEKCGEKGSRMGVSEIEVLEEELDRRMQISIIRQFVSVVKSIPQDCDPSVRDEIVKVLKRKLLCIAENQEDGDGEDNYGVGEDEIKNNSDVEY